MAPKPLTQHVGRREAGGPFARGQGPGHTQGGAVRVSCKLGGDTPGHRDTPQGRPTGIPWVPRALGPLTWQAGGPLPVAGGLTRPLLPASRPASPARCRAASPSLCRRCRCRWTAHPSGPGRALISHGPRPAATAAASAPVAALPPAAPFLHGCRRGRPRPTGPPVARAAPLHGGRLRNSGHLCL
jgi:hypothetical protein